MRLSSRQKGLCLAVMDKLAASHSFILYSQPVDPVQDNCHDYLDIIDQPMDFSTVRQKLTQNRYRSITKWKDDMALIWNNSIIYNGENSLIGLTAQHLRDTFRKLTRHLVDDEDTEWRNELTRLHDKVKRISGKLTQLLPPPHRQLHAIHDHRPGFEAFNMAPIEYPEPRHGKGKGKTFGQGPASVRRPEEEFTQAEKNRIAEQVNNLEDTAGPRAVNEVFELIKTYEPDLVNGSDDIDIEVDRMSSRTLAALRDLCDRFARQRN